MACQSLTASPACSTYPVFWLLLHQHRIWTPAGCRRWGEEVKTKGCGMSRSSHGCLLLLPLPPPSLWCRSSDLCSRATFMWLVQLSIKKLFLLLSSQLFQQVKDWTRSKYRRWLHMNPGCSMIWTWAPSLAVPLYVTPKPRRKLLRRRRRRKGTFKKAGHAICNSSIITDMRRRQTPPSLQEGLQKSSVLTPFQPPQASKCVA